MIQENRTKFKQVNNTQNSKDNAAIFWLDSNNNTGTDTEFLNGRRIDEINEESPFDKSSRGNGTRGGPDTDPPNS